VTDYYESDVNIMMTLGGTVMHYALIAEAW